MSEVEGYRGTYHEEHPEATRQYAWSLTPKNAEKFKQRLDEEFDYEDKICYNTHITNNGNILFLFDDGVFDLVEPLLSEVTQ